MRLIGTEEERKRVFFNVITMLETILSDEQKEFMTFCRDQEVLKFDPKSEFKLKSGRMSPWFFNAGNLMQTGEGLQKLAKIYVDTLLRTFENDGKVGTDILYGPAYKGIPLASIVTAELFRQTGQNLWFASHRKEEKDHGADKGSGFGMNVAWKTSIILDDVITAGTAARSSIEDIHADNGTVNGMVVLLDRQEVTPPDTGDKTRPPELGEPRVSAIMQLESAEWIKVVSALTFAHIRRAIEEWIIGDADIGEAMDAYNQMYWVTIPV